MGWYPLGCLRLLENKAFAAYLKCIEYSDDAQMLDLFSCRACEKVDHDGRRVLLAVVLDGTATGVLWKLPIFDG